MVRSIALIVPLGLRDVFREYQDSLSMYFLIFTLFERRQYNFIKHDYKWF